LDDHSTDDIPNARMIERPCPWFDAAWRQASGLPNGTRAPTDAGARPRCLLCHGFTGRAADWDDTPCGHCPAGYAVDLPGHGHAPAPTSPFLAEIDALLARIPGSIDHVIGYSLGGRLALAMLMRAPERFRAATLIAAHPGLEDPEARAERRAADRQWIDQLRREGIASFVETWERQPLFQTQARLPTSIRNRQRARRLAQRPEGLAAALATFGLGEMPNTWPALAHYPGQLHWVVGGLDPKFQRIAEAVQRIRPATQLQILEGVGHNPLLEWLAPANAEPSDP
jgi:2-succinyl-6-hydroxy-2,4-cyclohexadiene-1-carboxylate synthase